MYAFPSSTFVIFETHSSDPMSGIVTSSLWKIISPFVVISAQDPHKSFSVITSRVSSGCFTEVATSLPPTFNFFASSLLISAIVAFKAPVFVV